MGLHTEEGGDNAERGLSDLLPSLFGVATAVAEMVLVVTALLFSAAAWSGFVVMKMWLWFVVPFFGAPPLPFFSAVGIMVLATFLTGQVGTTEGFKTISYIGFFVVRPGIALALGYLIHIFAR